MFSSKYYLNFLGQTLSLLLLLKCLQCVVFFQFRSGQNISVNWNEGRIFLHNVIIVYFEDVSKSLWTSIPSEHLAKISKCFLDITTFMKMSNILLDITSERQVEISQAQRQHWDRVCRTRTQLFSVVSPQSVFTMTLIYRFSQG